MNSGNFLSIYYVCASASGVESVTFTGAGGIDIRVYIDEWSGVATSACLGTTKTAAASSTGNFTVTSGSLIVGGGNNGSATILPGAGFTAVSSLDTTYDGCNDGEFQTAAGTTVNVTWNAGTSRAVGAEFLVSGGGAVPLSIHKPLWANWIWLNSDWFRGGWFSL